MIFKLLMHRGFEGSALKGVRGHLGLCLVSSEGLFY